jgi:apolipoprotein N-acyltransferase
MGDIGASIFNGVLGAAGHALGLIPISVWLFLVVAVLAIVAIVRYLTDWHVILAVALLVVLLGVATSLHALGYIQGRTSMEATVKAAQEQVEAYRETNQKVIACYAREPAKHVWDRSQGKCLRTDGAIE